MASHPRLHSDIDSSINDFHTHQVSLWQATWGSLTEELHTWNVNWAAVEQRQSNYAVTPINCIVKYLHGLLNGRLTYIQLYYYTLQTLNPAGTDDFSMSNIKFWKTSVASCQIDIDKFWCFLRHLINVEISCWESCCTHTVTLL